MYREHYGLVRGPFEIARKEGHLPGGLADHQHRLRCEIPQEGLAFPIVITVQTDGATNFDEPVPVCFPNLPDPETGNRLPARPALRILRIVHFVIKRSRRSREWRDSYGSASP